MRLGRRDAFARVVIHRNADDDDRREQEHDVGAPAESVNGDRSTTGLPTRNSDRQDGNERQQRHAHRAGSNAALVRVGLVDGGVAGGEESRGVRSVLDAAAWTYVAGFATSVLTLLYYVMLVTGMRRDD